MGAQSDSGIEDAVGSGNGHSAVVAAVTLVRWRCLIRRIATGARGTTPASTVAIVTTISASTMRHSALTALHLLIARTHPGTSVSSLRLIPTRGAGGTWTWSSHRRVVGRRIA